MVNKAAVFEAMLRSGGWLATLPEAVRQAVFKASSVRTIAPGAALFEQDGPPTGLHGVFSGDIRVVGHSRDGRAVIMGVIHPGEWVGYLSCLAGLPHAYSGIASYGARPLSLAHREVATIFARGLAQSHLASGREPAKA